MFILTLGFSLAVIILVLTGAYKVFVQKKNVTPFYTPFEEITGQTEIEFHEEQEVIAEDEDQGVKK
ncbi:Protein of unknown function [Gracilibacillus ureilyticus]|uniref:DUF3951 domain-containing protein n=1 Tax=Gracilibacillus ureilyticus TaxID=531814 RepID=A0A1H9NPY4_9BACI|nr:DUF3951 domain-containing protein [Gracilibacillus ureilyticus]SER37705.1 Protein of unknown function [Gracilibacillus ureilyticus]